MSNPHLRELEKLAEKALQNPSSGKKKEHLMKAFALFSQEASALQSSYENLKNHFEKTHRELERANVSLQQKLEELNTTSSYLRNILSNMKQGLMFVNLAGIITTYNPAAEQLLAKEAIDVLFRPFSQVFNDDLFGFSLQKALREPLSSHHTTIIHLSDSRKRSDLEIDTKLVVKRKESLSLSPRDHTLDFDQGLIILIRDITEIQALRTVAERNQRMQELGEMASFIAHEIRNPLGGIKGFAALLQRDLQDNPQLHEMAGYILAGVDSLNRIVNDVLHYARPITLQRSQLDLRKLVEEIYRSAKLDHEHFSKITFTLLNAEEPIICWFDPQLMKSAIMNLLLNAARSMNGGGKLSLTVRSDGIQGCIEVKDEGCGIPEENMGKIFSPFFTTTNGNGFGLSITDKIVTAHGGELLVNSKVDLGTTVSLMLPITSASPKG